LYKIANIKQESFVLWVIFLTALSAVLIAVCTVVFPNLVIMTMSTIPEYFDVNPFESGIMSYPFLIANFILLGIVILYLKGRLPQKITNSIKFILNFEISTRMSLLIMLLLIGGFIVFTVNQLFTEEGFDDYYNRVKPTLQTWTIHDITKGFDLHVKYLLITASMKIFGSYRVIPYFASISLLVLAYFFTKLITKSRFAGIVSMVILLQSAIFLIYNSSVAYDNFWTLFYLLSLYAIYKFWPLSPISFIASLFTKPLTLVFLPFTFFFLYRSGISRRKKILVAISYVIVIIIGVAFAISVGVATSVTSINMQAFWSAYNAFTYQLRFDPIVEIFLLSVTIMLFMTARKGAKHADSILFLLMGTVLLQPLAAAFTPNSSEPYRFMPLVTFFAISVGMLLSKNVTVKEQVLPSRQ